MSTWFRASAVAIVLAGGASCDAAEDRHDAGGSLHAEDAGGASGHPEDSGSDEVSIEDAGTDAATTGACREARHVLECDLGGATATCLSDTDRCDVSGDAPCRDLCASGEHGVACGSIGPAPFVEPPAGCTSKLQTPGGPALYCCPD